MKIKRLVIENFKSIERIELVEPSPFTVFVGPNGSGKSNIFEALEFVNLQERAGGVTGGLFGGPESFLRKQNDANSFSVELESDAISFERGYYRNIVQRVTRETGGSEEFGYINRPKPSIAPNQANTNTFHNFTRLFVGKDKQQKMNFRDDSRLTFSADNLEKVLKRVLTKQVLKNEVFEWLELYVPEIKGVEIDDRDELHWFEQYSAEYFTKDLISDGTYNILAMLTAVYQSDEPQFLCIEEPENGLHPLVIESLVSFFRNVCIEKGHYIWLNTHSSSLVSQLRPEEIVLVEKREGATVTKQVGNQDLHNLETDYAWLSGALGGGLPW